MSESWDPEGRSPWSNPEFREAVRREDEGYRRAAAGTTPMVTEEAMLGWKRRAEMAEAEVARLRAASQPAQGANTAVAKLPELPTLPQALLNLIGEYGLARSDGTSDVERLHLWQLLIDGIKRYAAAAIALNAATEEDRTAILEATQAIRDHGRDLIENEWSSTGESLMAKAQKIERIVLKGTHEPR
jgi:hypothetical protein